MINNQWQIQNNLAALLKEPFDVEGELYSSILKGLISEQGLLIPDQYNLPLVDIDNLREAKVRNNLFKIPVSQKEDPFKKTIRVDRRDFLMFKIDQKSTERELCEIINNLEITPHEHLDCLIKTFYGELQSKFVELLSKNQIDLVTERLKLWGIDITRKFDLYCLNYDQLPESNFGVYNLYNLEQGLNNFSSLIPNSQLFLGNDQYLTKLVNIHKHLIVTNQWQG